MRWAMPGRVVVETLTRTVDGVLDGMLDRMVGGRFESMFAGMPTCTLYH